MLPYGKHYVGSGVRTSTKCYEIRKEAEMNDDWGR